MHPIKLALENFVSHGKSEINFDEFPIAVIVAKIRGNEKFSNGAGKSTIFSAIKYVLFNQIDFSTLDKAIRHGCDYCKVTFEFKANIDDCVYKIVRSKSRKSGSDVRLFKLNGIVWEDITQRRISDTEKEIAKIIKINYKTFCNTILFSQLDLSGLPSLTPEKRKAALKEALQLNLYSKYEELAKKKSSDLLKEIDKKTVLSQAFDDPEKTAIDLQGKILETETQLDLKQKYVFKLKSSYDGIYNNNLIIINNIKELELQSDKTEKKYKLLKQDLVTLNEQKALYNKKISSIIQDGKKIKTSMELFDKEIAEGSQSIKEEALFDLDIEKISSLLIEINSNIKNLSCTKNDLAVPLPDGSKCKSCRQILHDSHRITCQQEIDAELINVNTNIEKETEKLKQFKCKLQDLKINREENKKLRTRINSLIEQKKTQNNELNNLKSIYIEYEGLSKKIDIQIKEKSNEFTEVRNSYQNKDVESLQKLRDEQISLKEKLLNYDSILQKENKELTLISNQNAILIHDLNKANENIIKLSSIKKEILDLQASLSLHQKVVKAFSSGGIPALITKTILDDFQIQTNNFLYLLRPGLQVKFLVEKESASNDKEDTLEINYLLDGHEMEFAQLSGAQKLEVSLGLKLGLAAVIKNRLGVVINLLLIDEIDQSIDEGTLEPFEAAIKALQKEFKILIITHNRDLKSKFSHAIVVEQDENGVSTASLVNSW